MVIIGALMGLVFVAAQAYTIYTVAQVEAMVRSAPPLDDPPLLPVTAAREGEAPPPAPFSGARAPSVTRRGVPAAGAGASQAAPPTPVAGSIPVLSGEWLPPVTEGLPASHIRIPKIGVDSPIVEIRMFTDKGQWVWETPGSAVGHYAGTANPGEGNNIALAGHISTPLRGEGSVFKRLPELGPGDMIIVTDAEAKPFQYVVYETRVVHPTEVSVIRPTRREVLTLITCFPEWVYSHRLVVRAIPVEP